ncbi:MAG: hypothetical protein PHP32_00645 [Candidatus Izemoplasmatales bacterium]|nr:hypothetical protein [Candidatus Izemoplasmatales bacterium]
MEDLEKMIEEVKRQQAEEKKKLKKNRPENRNVIRIDLAARYSSSVVINLIVSFFVNFLLMFGLNAIFHFAEVANPYILLAIAFLFTLSEEAYKRLMLKKYLSVVMYTMGLIFFLFNVIVVWVLDLFVFDRMFDFNDPYYPVFFVLALSFLRTFVRSAYVRIVKAMSKSMAKSQTRR